MKPPRRASVYLAAAGVGLCVLIPRACVSVARAAEADPIAAGISSLDVLLTGSGITGFLLAASFFVHTLGRHNLLPGAAKPTPPADEHSAAHRAVWTTRDDARAIAQELIKDLRDDSDSAHERVRLTLREHEGRMMKIEDRAEDHRKEAATTLAVVQVALHSVEKALANLQGRLSPREH